MISCVYGHSWTRNSDTTAVNRGEKVAGGERRYDKQTGIPPPLCDGGCLLGRQDEAYSRDGPQEFRTRGIVLQLMAQPMDGGANDVGGSRIVEAPHVLQQLWRGD